MNEAELEKIAQKRQELQSQFQELESEEKSLEQERQKVEEQASELEKKIRQLAQEEAEIQKRKKELQSMAKQIGQSRTSYLKQQKKISKQRESLQVQMQQLSKQESETKEQLDEEQKLRQQLQAQDEQWRAQQKAHEEALRQEEEKRRQEAEAKARENRTSPRIAVAVDVSMQTEHNFYMGLTENLSEGGLFIATYDTLPIGTRLELNLNLPGSQPFKTECEVRWVREFSQFTEDVTPGIGVRFLDLDEQHQKIIREFLSQRDPILYEDP